MNKIARTLLASLAVLGVIAAVPAVASADELAPGATVVVNPGAAVVVVPPSPAVVIEGRGPDYPGDRVRFEHERIERERLARERFERARWERDHRGFDRGRR